MVRETSASSLVYSALSAYGTRRGDELPGVWFVRAFEPFGHAPASVRQTLFRMVRERELEARPRGRVKLFRLSAYGRAAIEAGTEKLFAEPEDEWDGTWTLVQYQFSERDRIERDRVRDLLDTEGFAPLGRGIFLHPRDRTARLGAALAQSGREHDVMLFRARRIGSEPDRALVERLWPLARLDEGYGRFLERFQPLVKRSPRGWKPEEAFAARFAVAISYLEIAWDDPDLPAALLPKGWKGGRARILARELYERLLPGTLAHGDALIEQVLAARAVRNTNEVRR